MKILISGSRKFEDYPFLDKTMTDIISSEQYRLEIPNKELEVVSGNNPRGADYLGEKWAKSNNLKLTLFPADWNDMKPKIPANWGNNPSVSEGTNFYGVYNKMAGILRNQRMANYVWPDGICIAFDMGTPGTKDMIRRCKRQGIKTYQIKFDEKSNEWKTKIWNGE